ncbi:MAG: helix-turn-helix domain-containing protein [Bacteroidales bacterium]|nr:helix-turn-helix domain-containing protein [Bacteroidales bacterium]
MESLVIVILLLNPAYVSLFWAINLFIPRKEKNIPRQYLGIIMMVSFLIFISHFFYFLRIHEVYILIDTFYHFASLALYPMYYIYVLLVVSDHKFSFRKHYPYLLPATILFLLSVYGYIRMEYEKDYHYISQTIYGIGTSDPDLVFIRNIQSAERVVYLLQLVIFGYLTTRKIRRYRMLQVERFSFPEKWNINWVWVSSMVLMLGMAMSAIYTVAGRSSFIDDPLRIAFPSTLYTVLIFIVGVFGNSQRPVIIPEEEDHCSEEVPDEKVPARLKADLMALFEKEQVYLNKDLTIWDVTARLGTNRTYVSKIINNDMGLTFTVFVNNFRVSHAISLLRGNNNLPVDELADLSGFGSANSLYRSFLLKEGMSVAEYRRLLKSGAKLN